jgi:hypothetical protein
MEHGTGKPVAILSAVELCQRAPPFQFIINIQRFSPESFMPVSPENLIQP